MVLSHRSGISDLIFYIILKQKIWIRTLKTSFLVPTLLDLDLKK